MKRFLGWSMGALAAVAFALWFTVQLTPWPSVLLIRHAFAEGGRASAQALEKHVPAGVAERRDLRYGDGRDETFDIYYPEGTSGPRPTLVWIHGGAWVSGTKSDIANYLKIVASHGYTVIGLDYETAPTATYPTPVRQVMTALAYLQAHAQSLNIDVGSIVLAGDSAGAQIAAQVVNLITAPDYARAVGIAPTLAPEHLKGVVLFCGAYDLSTVDFGGPYAWFLRTVLWAYSGVKTIADDDAFRLASVAEYVTPRFPPAFVSGGNGDPLTPQSTALVGRLDGLGVPTDALFFPKDRAPALPHEYQFNLDDRAGQQALQRLLGFLAAHAAPHG